MSQSGLRADRLTCGYRGTDVVHDASVSLVAGTVVALIGPNGSGKSTVLRSMARLHQLTSGALQVAEGGSERDAMLLSAREFARHTTLLAQSRPQPAGISVLDVVAFGRHPHRHRFAPLSDDDHAAIRRALHITGIDAMTCRPVDELSGGELQRVWLATCLAQDTGVVLLDEPTNHLDLRYQVDILQLIQQLADNGKAVGVVLHDLSHAAVVADHIVLLKAGKIYAEGSPEIVLTTQTLSAVYGLDIHTHQDPQTGLMHVQPLALRRRTQDR